MKRYSETLKYDWQFTRGEIADAQYDYCTFDGWKTVRVPHDYAIEGPYDPTHDKGNTVVNADGFPVSTDAAGRTGALPLAGTAWYRRTVNIPKEWEGNEISLEFDGVMSHCEIYVNGKLLKKNVYGYTSFNVIITDAAEFGKDNIITVRVSQEPWESRWYPGAGIYRNVRLVAKSASNFAYNTVYITTPEVGTDKASVSIKADITAPISGEVVDIVILDANKNAVATATVPVSEGKVAADITVNSPKLWENSSPYLYTVKLSLRSDGEVLDTSLTRIGIRELSFDRYTGFYVNSKSTKLKGVCMHHDLGAIGAAVNESALRRQFKILMDMGINSIRTTHNPPTPELLDIADELGIYVIVEQFDQWKMSKTTNGYGLYFDKWAESDFTATIRRDRNHPCVIMWSIGNEVSDQADKNGGKTAKFLSDIAHREDPSRKTTMGLHIDDAARINGLNKVVDIVGWNYRPHLYEMYHTYSNDIIYGSETESCVSSRGVYFIPEKKAISADEEPLTISDMYIYGRCPWRRYDNVEIPAPVRNETQVSSYDLSAPRWAYYPEVEFAAQDDHPYVLGEYVWTGFDYMGEPTPYGTYAVGGKLARSTYFGIVDLAGLPKDRYYSYMSKWTDKEVLHLFPHWNWKDGDVLPVHCYSSYKRAELFVNGKSYGIREKKPDSDNCLERHRLIWNDVKFEAGELTVKALDDNGNVLKTETIRTAGEPAMLELTADRSEYKADGDDLCYVTVRVLDKDGNLCPKADTRMKFTVSGEGEFIASDNGDPTNLEVFKSPFRNAFSGMAVGIFRTIIGKPGEMKITAKADGMDEVSITVPVV